MNLEKSKEIVLNKCDITLFIVQDIAYRSLFYVSDVDPYHINLHFLYCICFFSVCSMAPSYSFAFKIYKFEVEFKDL